MKEKLIPRLLATKNSSHFIRIIAGAYVTYLGGSIVYSRVIGEAVTTGQLLCGILLALIGAAIAFLGLYAIANGYSVEYKGVKPWAAANAIETEETDEPEETAETGDPDSETDKEQ